MYNLAQSQQFKSITRASFLFNIFSVSLVSFSEEDYQFVEKLMRNQARANFVSYDPFQKNRFI